MTLFDETATTPYENTELFHLLQAYRRKKTTVILLQAHALLRDLGELIKYLEELDYPDSEIPLLDGGTDDA